MTGNNPRHAILIQGADSLGFAEDTAEALRRGFSVQEPTLPPFSGHPIDARWAHFDAVGDIVSRIIDKIRADAPAARIAAIGRNNGGGQLAWAAARGLAIDAMALVGAIPEISRYRRESNAPSAQKFRQSLAGEAEWARISEMRPLDIITISKFIKCPCLLQFGRNDPFIDETATEAAEILGKRFPVEWLDDDHAMVSPDTLRQRWDFLEGALTHGSTGPHKKRGRAA